MYTSIYIFAKRKKNGEVRARARARHVIVNGAPDERGPFLFASVYASARLLWRRACVTKEIERQDLRSERAGISCIIKAPWFCATRSWNRSDVTHSLRSYTFLAVLLVLPTPRAFFFFATTIFAIHKSFAMNWFFFHLHKTRVPKLNSWWFCLQDSISISEIYLNI